MMIKNKKVAVIILLVCFLIIGIIFYKVILNRGNNNMEEKQMKLSYTDILPEHAKKRIDNKEKIMILDVRTEEEYNQGHISNAVLLPLNQIQEKANDIITNKEEIVFVYCRSGVRSIQASKKLVELGYKNIYNIGGIIDWKYEIEK